MRTNLKDVLFRKRLIVLIGVLLTVAAAPVGILTFNQYRDAEATVSDALRRDAQSYAADYGVGLDEAIRRLQLQDTIGDFDSQLQSNEAGTFGGLWIENGQAQSDFKVVVLFTESGQETIQQYGKYVANGILSGMVEVRRAEATLATLRSNRTQAIENIAALGVPVESTINVPENRAEIYVVERARLNSAMSANGVVLPSHTEIISVDGFSAKASNIYGGLDVSCTTGFSVEDEDGEKGVTTAGHCNDNLSYKGTSLTMEDEHYNGRVDLQYHTSSFTEKPWVNDGGSNPRTIRGTRGSHSVGQYVCKHGRESGNSCGYVKHVDYQPTITSGCEPSPCDWDDDWVYVRSLGNADMCTQGDSGGPVYAANTAVGSVSFCHARSGSNHGENNNDDMIYMRVNYFDDMDLAVLLHSD